MESKQHLTLHWHDLSPSPLNDLVRGGQAEAEADIEELAASIAESGVIQPLVITKTPDGPTPYQIVTGERRWRAVRSLGDEAPSLPCIVRSAMKELDQLIVMGAENFQRRNPNPVIEARYYQALQERGLVTLGDIAGKTGKTTVHIKSRLDILDLPEPVQTHIEAGRIPLSATKMLTGLAPELQVQVSEKVVGKNAKYIAQVVELVKKRTTTNGTSQRNGLPKPDGQPPDLKQQVKFLRMLVSKLAGQVRLDAEVVMTCAERLAFYDDELAESAFDHANRINEQIRSAVNGK